MTISLRSVLSIFMLGLSLTEIPGTAPYFLIMVFFIILKICIPVPLKDILKKNLLILSFISFYLFFGIISLFIDGGNLIILLKVSLKIIIIFNIIWFSFRWIGINGRLWLIGVIPSERLKLFIILIVKGIYQFRRNSEMIVMQLKSRMETSAQNRRILARYYIRNMIYKQLYTIQYLQASLYTRLPENFTMYVSPEKTALAEGLILCSIAVFFVKIFIF